MNGMLKLNLLDGVKVYLIDDTVYNSNFLMQHSLMLDFLIIYHFAFSHRLSLSYTVWLCIIWFIFLFHQLWFSWLINSWDINWKFFFLLRKLGLLALLDGPLNQAHDHSMSINLDVWWEYCHKWLDVPTHLVFLWNLCEYRTCNSLIMG